MCSALEDEGAAGGGAISSSGGAASLSDGAVLAPVFTPLPGQPALRSRSSVGGYLDKADFKQTSFVLF